MKKILYTALLCALCLPMFALDAPNPTNPSDGITGAYVRQQIYWSTVSGAGKYELQMDTTGKFNSPELIEKTYTSNSSQYVYGLRYHTKYYWRMRYVSSNSDDVKSDWCAVRTFTTIARPTLELINDSDATQNYYPKQTFKWKTTFGSTKYVVEIDTVEDFSSKAKCQYTYSDSEKSSDTYYSTTIGNLYLGCFNYWRVKAYNAKDSSEWSKTFRFHTLRKAKGSRPDGLTNAYTQQTLYWTYYTGLDKVIIELDTTASFNSPALRKINDSGSSSDYCYHTESNLYFGTTYYWRVKSYHAKDTTDWSAVLSFTTYNFCTLSTPADSATNRYTSGTLYWKYSTGISKYQVQMDTVKTFDSPALYTKMESASSNDNAYMSYSELYFGKTYYWRVRECHQNDTSKWSETRCFTTYRHCTLNAKPTDNATEVSTSPSIYFDYASGISKYQMQLDTTPAFNSPELISHIESASGSSNAYHSYTDLYFGTTYYRRVRECHSKDTTDWSPTHCFTTIVSAAYASNSITKGATGQSIKPKLYYYYRSYIDSIEIQIDTTENFNSTQLQVIRAREENSSSYCWEQPQKELLYGTLYYWRIRDKHARDVSDWTTPRYFTTTYITPAVTAVSPADLEVVIAENNATDFTWNLYPSATEYTWQLAESNSFDSIIMQQSVSDTTMAVQLPLNRNLYWRVQAFVPTVGRSAWSTVRALSTKDSASLYSLGTPVISKPAEDQLSNCYTRLYFNWSTVSGAAKYVLQIDTTATFNSPELIEQSFTSVKDNVIWNLRYGTRYYYRVRALAENGMDKSRWSTTRQLTTMSSATPTSPNDPQVESVWYPNPTMKWKNSYGSTKYTIEVDTTSRFDSPAKMSKTYSTYASNTDETLSQDFTSLYLGKMTYWRVKAENNKYSADWSETLSFKTYNNAECSSPADGASDRYTTLSLYWKRINGLPKVIIELDTVSDFSSAAKRVVNSYAYYDDDDNTTVSGLYFGKTYYWRVRYYHDNDTTRWSAIRSFSTYNCCNLSSPADDATNRLTTSKLYWEWSKGISRYQVQVDTVNTFNSPALVSVIESASSSDYAYYQYEKLLFGTSYYWRVRECQENDTSRWSEIRKFTTYARGLQGSTPADGATNIYVCPLLRIDYTNNISTYFVQLDTAKTFDSGLLRTEKVTCSSSSYAYWDVTDTLLYGTTYYWRVADAHEKDTSDWAWPYSFTTAYQLPGPGIVSPQNQTVVQDNQLVVFSWNACGDATTYVIQVATDGQFNNIVHEEIVNGTSTSFVLKPAAGSTATDGIYYWRVQAINDKGRSPWSTIWCVKTQSSTPTVLENAECEMQNAKWIENGRLLIMHGGKVYDATGRCVLGSR